MVTMATKEVTSCYKVQGENMGWKQLQGRTL